MSTKTSTSTQVLQTTTNNITAVANSANTALHQAADSTPQTIQHAASKTVQTVQHILHWDDLPSWMQIDPHIRRGYRRQLDSFSACFRSLFYPHNEFVNTWSHLLPALAYLALLFGVDYEMFRHELGKVRGSDKAVVQLYVMGTAACLGLSVSTLPFVRHIFYAHISASKPTICACFDIMIQKNKGHT